MSHLVPPCILLGILLVITTLATGVISGGGATLSCDFEANNLCQYRNYKKSSVLWSVRKAKTVGHGPTKDRTLQTDEGHYAYLEGSGNVYTDLETPSINLATPGYLSFWYYVSNKNHAYIDMWAVADLKYYDMLDITYPMGRGQDNEWVQGKVQLSSMVNSVIKFSGQISDKNVSAHHFIALDDIKFTPGS